MQDVDIVNEALGKLGIDPIGSLNDQVKPAIKANAIYASVRDGVLEESELTFSIGRFQPAIDAQAPLGSDYTARYPKDPTILRVIDAEEATGSPGVVDGFMAAMMPDYDAGLDFDVEGSWIVANTGAAKLNVKAVVQVTDPTKFSPNFCRALAARLAAELAMPLTENRGKEQDCWKEYLAKLSAARAADGRQGRSKKMKKSSALRRRF